jgi:colanic acid/amylovoran biosynthesis protein
MALGVPPDAIRVAPDAAFLLAREDLPSAARSCPSGAPRVALSLREWPFFRSADGQAAYERAVGELCAWLVGEKQAEITCISTCQGIPEYWADDSRPAQRMAEGLPPGVREHVVVDHSFHPPRALRDHLAGFDVVVATRLHAAILSMTAGTPVVVIEYERKAYEVFGQMDLEEWVLDIEGIEGRQLIERVDRMLGQLGRVRERLAEQVARQRDLADAVAAELRAVVAGLEPEA